MTKLSKKGLLLFISALAMAAFAMPSMASAATFDPPSTSHTLTSSNLSFTAATLGGGSICSSASFATDVSAAGAASITSATFSGCTGTDGLSTCTDVTATGTGFPWTVTAESTNAIVIDGIHIVVTFGGPCTGTSVTLEGSLTADWNNTTHTAQFTNANGLTATAGGVDAATVVNGTATDVQHTLVIT